MLYKNTKQNIDIDFISLSVVLYIIPIFFYYVKGFYIFAYLGIFSSLTSFLYHITYEQSKLYLYLDMLFAIISFIYLVYDIILYTNSILEYYWYIILLLFSITSYLCGTGRQKELNRHIKYIIFHTSWHLLIFILSISHAYLKN